MKKLRDATGAGMMDAKKALTEADGDFDKAIELLRVAGQAKAAKRGAERAATNGLVAFADGALVQLAAETDFVAKNAEFQALADDVVKAVAAAKADSVEAANAATLESGKTVAEAVSELAATIGEKLEIANAAYFDGQTAVYLHKRASDLPPAGGRRRAVRRRRRGCGPDRRDAGGRDAPAVPGSRTRSPPICSRTSAGSPRPRPRRRTSRRRRYRGSSRAG